MRFSLPVLCITALFVVGCDRKPAELTGAGPAFDPIGFFTGHTHSQGVIESRSGSPTEWIVTDSHAETDPSGRLRMAQSLSFQDGSKQQRNWTLWRSGPDRFEATANDMVGTAHGETNGRVFHWQWVLARSPGNDLMNVTMNQWMYRLDDGSVMIRTTVTKLGIILAEVSEQFSHVAES